MGKVEAKKWDFRIVPASQYLVPEQRESWQLPYV